MPRTRIAFLTDADCYGGVEKYLEYLICGFDLSKVEPIILDFGTDYYTQPIKQRHNLPITVGTGLKSSGFRGFWSLFREIDPHVIVFVKRNPLMFPLAAHLAAKLSGDRRVCAIEQLIADPPPPKTRMGKSPNSWLRRIAGWRTRLMLRMRLRGRLCDVTICGSDQVREKLVRDYKYPADRTIAVPNGVDLRFYSSRKSRATPVRKDLGMRPDEDVLVCVSRLVKRKGVDTLLEALFAITKEHQFGKCIIVGDGPMKGELSTRASELGLASSVVFVGHKEDVKPYLETGDIFVHATEGDGLPLALLEAMACGLPCIAGTVDGRSEIIVDRENGLLVRPGSVGELTDAIRYLLVNTAERERIAINARRRAEDFSVDETITRTRASLLPS
jgi:glycosyltransferase involved in cell wall biosynthesis